MFMDGLKQILIKRLENKEIGSPNGLPERCQQGAKSSGPIDHLLN